MLEKIIHFIMGNYVDENFKPDKNYKDKLFEGRTFRLILALIIYVPLGLYILISRTFLIPDTNAEFEFLKNGQQIAFYETKGRKENKIEISPFLQERNLTTVEKERIFSDLSFTGKGLFEKSTGKLIAVKGSIQNTIILIADKDKIKIDVPKVSMKKKNSNYINDVRTYGWFYKIKLDHNKKNNDIYDIKTIRCVTFYLKDKLVYIEHTSSGYYDIGTELKNIGNFVILLTEKLNIDFYNFSY